MPVTKEFPELIEDRPSMLGKVCQAFADQEVNILVLPDPREICNSTHHRQAGHPQTVLDNEKLTYAEKVILQIKIQHRPGEIATSRLGKAHININYAYCGLEPGTHAPLAFFGAGEVGGLPG